ncbi:proteasomal ATPase-associated factor 1-like [Plakobranchus ocellatus]|uniref:Proteasomal ATPase-associated factor 1-like n=1 Tax=Plakobranchus ocellatus TaxID=259542 RepID=A0AAV3ZR55_9GAST|nr:proteasomal ATPase-associated factor 1-like [Plakobranchus ocellatus]
MAAPIERLILQSDWDQALRERNGKAWVSHKSSVPPCDYSELHGHGVSQDGLLYVTSKDEEFSVSNITKKSLLISFNGEQGSLSRKFVAPTITFSTIHTPKKQVVSIDTTPGGLGVSSDSEGKLKLWQTNTGEVRRNLEGHVGDVYTCQFFPSGIVVLSAGADMMVKVWSAETGACAATITGHKAAILGSDIIDRGRNIVTCSRDGTAKLWDVGQQACLYTFEEIGGDVNSCCTGIPANSIDLGTPSITRSDREIGTESKMLLLGCENGSLQGFGLESRDGSCFHITEHWETTTELTGSDCDPIYSISSDGENIFTSCRDGSIRKYSLRYIT